MLEDVGGRAANCALVYHNQRVSKVVLDVGGGPAGLVASGGNSEVFAVPLARTLSRHVPWPSSGALLGEVMGYDERGLLVRSSPLMLCPGPADSLYRTCCVHRERQRSPGPQAPARQPGNPAAATGDGTSEGTARAGGQRSGRDTLQL